MEEALKMGKTSAHGGLRLFFGIVVSNVIMAVGTIILARLLSPTEYGLYAIAMVPSLLINLFRDWGVNSAITRYVAGSKVTGKEENIREIIVAGVIFEISTGLVLCLLSIFLSGFIASTILHRPEAAPFISIIAITTFSGSLLAAAQSSFVGLERMEFTSLTLISQAVVKSVASPLLVIFGFGVMGPVLGYTLSFILSALIGFAMLYFFLFRTLKKTKISRANLRNTLRIMLHYGVPLSMATILEGFLLQFYSFMMAIYISDNALIGNFQVAVNFSVLLTFLTFPISTVLFPAFAKLDPTNNQRLLKTVFTSSAKYSAMVLVPATLAVMVLSKPMINTLFGEAYVYAPLFLTVYVLSNILLALGNLSIGGFLRGLGETKTLLKLDLLTQSLGIPLAFLLIPNLGIMGVIAGPILAGIPSLFVGLLWIWKRYKITVDWRSSAKILVASGAAALATYLSLNLINTAALLRLIAGGVVFLSTFVILAPSIGAIARSDISDLRAILSGFGFISRIADPPLFIVEQLADKTRFSRKD